MIENLKAVLLNKLNDEVVEYNKIKEQYDQMAEKIKEDNSDFEYDQRKKDLKKEYGMKRFSKKAEYQQKLNEIEKEYAEFSNDPNTSVEASTKGVTGLDVVGNVIYVQTWDGIYTLENDTITKITN